MCGKREGCIFCVFYFWQTFPLANVETLAKVMNKARLQSFHLTLQANISLEHGSFITSHDSQNPVGNPSTPLQSVGRGALSGAAKIEEFFNSFLSLTQFSNYVLHGKFVKNGDFCLLKMESLLKMLIPIT